MSTNSIELRKKRYFERSPLFECLPNEMLICIMFYVHVSELTNVRLISKRWNEIIDDSEYFWKKQCELWNMDFSIYEKEFGGVYKEKKNYREKFIKRFLSYQQNLGRDSVFPYLDLSKFGVSMLEEMYRQSPIYSDDPNHDVEIGEFYPIEYVNTHVVFDDFGGMDSIIVDGNPFFCTLEINESNRWIVCVYNYNGEIEKVYTFSENIIPFEIRFLNGNNILIKCSREEEPFYNVTLIKLEMRDQGSGNKILKHVEDCWIDNVRSSYYNSIFNCLFLYIYAYEIREEEIFMVNLNLFQKFESEVFFKLGRFKKDFRDLSEMKGLDQGWSERIKNGDVFVLKNILFEDNYVIICLDCFLIIRKLICNENGDVKIELDTGSEWMKWYKGTIENKTRSVCSFKCSFIHNGIIYVEDSVEILSIDIHTLKVKKVFQKFDDFASFVSFITLFTDKNMLLTIENDLIDTESEKIQYQILGNAVQMWSNCPNKEEKKRIRFDGFSKYCDMSMLKIRDSEIGGEILPNGMDQEYFVYRGNVVKKKTFAFTTDGKREACFDVYHMFDLRTLKKYVHKVKHPSFLMQKRFFVFGHVEKSTDPRPVDISKGFNETHFL